MISPHMHWHDIELSLIALFSEVLGTVSGFGSSTFFVPAASYFEKIHFVLALTSILHCFGNTSKLYLFREHFDWKLFLKMAIPSVLLTGFGAMLASYVPSATLQRGLGLVLVVVALVFLIGKLRFHRLPTFVAIFLSGISGFSTGLVGTGGAIRGIALGALNLDRGAFVALSSAIDFGGDFLRMIIYIRNGFMDWSQWFYIPIFAIAAYLGASLGKRALGAMRQESFERVVALFVLAGGIAMIL